MKLRPAIPEDAAAIGELWFESWQSTGPEDASVTKADLIKRATGELADRWEVTVAEADGVLLGFVALAPNERRLDQLFIAPHAQGRGIGAVLLKLAKQRFAEGFWLRVGAANTRAIAFYEREGLAANHSESNEARVKYSFKP